MGIGKQAKILNRSQVEAVLNHINGRRYGLRNQVIFLLSIRAGLRAKEIAALRWSMIVGADGEVGEYIHLTNDASKGMSGRIIPINRQLRAKIIELFDTGDIDPNAHVIRTERSAHTSAQAIVNLFQRWYRDLGLVPPFAAESYLWSDPLHVAVAAQLGLLAGQTDFMFDNLASSLAQVKAGKLLAFAVTTTRRAESMPDVPTMAESGLPGFDVSTWFGVFAPAGTPPAVVERLNREFTAALRSPEMRERLARMGAEPAPMTPAAR